MLPSRRRLLALPLASMGALPLLCMGAVPLPGMGAVPATRAADASRAPIAWTDVTLLDGSVLRADTLRGRPVVVEFWASWCPFCRRQNPQLQVLLDAQRTRGLRMLTFSIDRDPAAARAYVAEHGYTFPAAMASPASARWFGTRKGLPMLYVVGTTGRIVFEEAGEMFAEDVAALARFATDGGA